jgi:hypothetical protein
MSEATAGTELCCRTCRLKVSRVRLPGGRIRYTHHGDRGHPIEPVAMDTADVIHVCDFCMTPHPRWCIPLEEHATVSSDVHPELGWTVTAVDTDGWWAACQVCVELVSTRQVGKLRDRAFASAAESKGPLDDWEKQAIIGRLAAFWLAVPGPAVEIM